MNQERLLKILLGPHISEKATSGADAHNYYVFKVLPNASKSEVKKAVESVFDVDVVNVSTINVKGKMKRTARSVGKRSNWKKAYVKLEAGQEIDFLDAE